MKRFLSYFLILSILFIYSCDHDHKQPQKDIVNKVPDGQAQLFDKVPLDIAHVGESPINKAPIEIHSFGDLDGPKNESSNMNCKNGVCEYNPEINIKNELYKVPDTKGSKFLIPKFEQQPLAYFRDFDAK